MTVIVPDDPSLCAVDVRGGGPGTRETDTLALGVWSTESMPSFYQAAQSTASPLQMQSAPSWGQKASDLLPGRPHSCVPNRAIGNPVR